MDCINRTLCLILCFFCSISYAQQITVDNTVSPQQLVENTLIQGCVEVSNISSPSNGSSIGLGSFGYFERGASSFPFQNGIVLATGNANSAGNGQNNTILNAGDNTWTTDSDLESALGITGTLNATSIEFNFSSISNQIQFNYILASEEYFGNFPCQYSDGFAFLIRETGTNNPYTNIALIPGTTTPVNTNTVHDEIVGFCDALNEQYFEGYNVGDTNYNGRTTVLSATANIQPNVQYQIKLVIADQADKNYDSAVFIEGNSFNASVNLGEDLTTCASNVIINGDIQNPQATYSWFFNGGLIPAATQPLFNAVQTGNYRVEIEIPLSGSTCIIGDDVTITLSSTQSSDPISDFELCDDLSNNGIEIFDLTTKDSEVLASVPTSNYTISYHYLDVEAQNGINAINNPIQNTTNPQIIYTRIEDTDNGCLAFSTINLIVNPLPSIVDPSPLMVCDDQTADGFTTIDLNVKNDEITSGQANLVVTYHSSEINAVSGSNPLPMPYVNINTNEQVFVSVINTQTGCISTTTLEISVLDNPTINTDNHYIDACDADHDGFAEFDLTSIIPEVLEGLTGVTVTFYVSIEDALSGTNPIANDTNYANININEQIVFIRVENNTTGCASITPIEIHTNLLLTATNINDVSLCDIDNDGIEEFSFESIALGIVHELEDITVVFYETEDDRDNQTNPIDQSVPYTPASNPQTIYLELSSLTCIDVADINLILVPIQEFQSIPNQTVCDEDQDGFTNTDLSQFNILVTNGLTDFTVTYFRSESDANTNTNPLPSFYTNTSNPFTVFPRIQSIVTGCFDINSFEITVLEAPISSAPSQIVICDDDQDGFSQVNLLNVVTEIVTDTNERIISFHNSQVDADNNSNAITNEAVYNSQTETIFIRVENSVTGCHSTETLSIIVNTLPVFIPINNYKICEDNSDGFGGFIFNTKDAEILNGQTGKQTSYYLNQTDADNRVNVIDKTLSYQNTTNPQLIYVRVENVTDQDCYGTSNFTIEVGTNPIFNTPTDWFVCDNLGNDGYEIFDLSTKVTEVSEGVLDNLSVTFYTSQFNAENSINTLPLQFTNTVNPQQIFVQIDNGTICNSITSFELNVVQVPDVNESSPITECDDDSDGLTQFDLTTTEIEILDVRQDNIEIAYFQSFDDLESNTNQISNPEAYTNVSNPQTVYIKITNTISNCYVTVPIDLIVNMPPPINDFMTYNICANDNNSFNLNEINAALMDESFNVLFNYFTNEVDANTNTNALDTNYTYQTNSDILFTRVEFSTTHCYLIYEFNLNVNPLPIANLPNDLMACDDDFNGLLDVDLTQQNSSILNGQSPTLFTVTYHNTELQAQEDNSALETNYMAFDSEIIYVRVEDNSTGCYSITQFSVVINPLPVIDIEDQVICLDNLPLMVSANTNNPTDQYIWSTGETAPEIEILNIGTYWVTVTSEFGCENTRVFGVSESEAATIEVTEIVDFSDPNNITVTISGIGDYLYQLDDFEPQESNVFENVAMGYHTVTIIDLNGCTNVTKEVLVIDAPKFFTPNNDGAFDTWHIIGVETLPGTIIYIFNRYGKLLKQLGTNTPGWDGFYNGIEMPTSDYWFVANVKRGNISFEVKGHFTLKR
ncbi:choice-of-anchor L domain-containing protein [uncultured Winogradskyella sp.]|uniref:T9SS type B sorting domain-containing protein n=1 Tax=uncultured Winogradskyella sp. TaxID=395353 RepID=UPI0030DA400B|tara:strand:+ start:2482 stop:7308 length:4827 start_codon:yes stop_codon:yes gene_type:complete